MINSNTRGGLGNRLKNIVSCMKLSEEYNLPINIIWEKKPFVCNCEFNYLFSNNFLVNKSIKSKLEYPFGPFACWRLYVSDKDIIPNNFTIVKKDNHGNNLSGDPNFKKFIDFEYNRIPSDLKNQYIKYFSLLNLNQDLLNKVNNFSEKYFNKDTISVHIRSWPVKGWDIDIKRSKQVKLDNFIKEMEKHKDGNFFLATDSDEVKEKMKNHFGNKLTTFDENTKLCDEKGNQLNRNNKIGIQNDLVELYLLSKNNIIIGSHSSSFTEVAWYLGGCVEKITII